MIALTLRATATELISNLRADPRILAQQVENPWETVGEVLARRVEARRGAGSAWAEALRELGAVDRAAYEAVARDVVVGSILGAGTAAMVAAVPDGRASRRRRRLYLR